MKSGANIMRVMLREYPDRKSAMSEAKRLAIEYSETVDVRPSAVGSAVLVSPALLIKLKMPKVPAVQALALIEPPVSRLKLPDNVPVKERNSAVVQLHEISIEPIETNRQQSLRASRMVAELRHAYYAAPATEMSNWASMVFVHFGKAFTRRIGNVVDLSLLILESGGREIIDLTGALFKGKAGNHLSERRRALALAASSKAQVWGAEIKPLVEAFRANPGEVGPNLLVAALAFSLAGGGLDGDGGIPDTDIALMGIDAHRSLFTHSILAGAVLETGLVGLVDLVQRAHQYLPSTHDSLWDTINVRTAQASAMAARGASVGLAYHFGVDAILQPAAYHDLPFSTSIEAHQTIMGVNAVGEGMSAREPLSKYAQNTSKIQPPPVKRDAAGMAVGALTAVAALLFWG